MILFLHNTGANPKDGETNKKIDERSEQIKGRNMQGEENKSGRDGVKTGSRSWRLVTPEPPAHIKT